MAAFIKIIFIVKIYQIYVLLNEHKKHVAFSGPECHFKGNVFMFWNCTYMLYTLSTK